MHSNVETLRENAMDGPVEGAGVARFRRRAQWAIVVFLVLFAAGTLLHRTVWPVDEKARYAGILGESYTNVILYFGLPQRENDDGHGGRVTHFDELQVVGDHFEEREFRIYLNADGRVYKFERD